MIGLAASVALAAQAASPPVTLHGIGKLRIGMTVSELRRLGGKVESGAYEPDCSYWIVPGREGLALMVSGERVVRIDVNGSEYRTLSGAHVGISRTQLHRIYGKALSIEPHPYTAPEGHYLVYRARSEPYGMIFETFGDPAESFRVGLWDHVQLIEGCS